MKALSFLAVAALLLSLPGCSALSEFASSPDVQAVADSFSNPPLEVVECVEVIGAWVLRLGFDLIKLAIPF